MTNTERLVQGACPGCLKNSKMISAARAPQAKRAGGGDEAREGRR